VTAFKDLGLAPEIQQALDELGYEEPSPIQEKAIPELLAGHDVIGQAQTGTGKTAAFGLPLLQYIDPGVDEVQAVVLTPTRELCIQVTQALRAYAEHLEVEIVAVFGGAPIRSQQSQLRAGAHVVVATVGRMMDLMSRRSRTSRRSCECARAGARRRSSRRRCRHRSNTSPRATCTTRRRSKSRRRS
jgi:ATP-dependent RNA helicase DeaD